LSEPVGALLASGRDSDIFEYGPGQVLRRTRTGRSIAHEAEIMRYVAQRGLRVPAIYHVLDDGRELVMERIDGPTMGGAIERQPWKIRSFGRELARLHQQLHAIPPPAWLPPFGPGGPAVVHRDLHPLNVLMSPTGPVVIDWANAAAAQPEVDVTDAWLVTATGGVADASPVMRVLLKFRRLLVDAFVGEFDRATLVPFLRGAVEMRSLDRNLSSEEVAAMWRLVAKEEAKLRKRARTSAAG
jgi:aminoglycoside phosphotransferase (APT) family kinase protein